MVYGILGWVLLIAIWHALGAAVGLVIMNALFGVILLWYLAKATESKGKIQVRGVER